VPHSASPPSHPGNGQSLATPAPQAHAAASHPYAPNDMSGTGLSIPGQVSFNADTPVRLQLSTFAEAPGAAPDMDGLALRIAAKSAGGESEFTVRLDPPALGRIEVTLNVNSQGAAQASLSADKPHTLELLQRDAPALERALKDAGLDLADGLSFSLKSDGQQGDWRNAQAQHQANPIRINTVEPSSSTPAVPAAAFITNGWGAGTARLDITV
jgi:flagellar hook-length control protein FliK